jgi:hypothetical protein
MALQSQIQIQALQFELWRICEWWRGGGERRRGWSHGADPRGAVVNPGADCVVEILSLNLKIWASVSSDGMSRDKHIERDPFQNVMNKHKAPSWYIMETEGTV